jgi:uncharacterized protein (TIGR02231 family)
MIPRKYPSFLCLLISSGVVGTLGASIPVESNVASATVYQDRAVLTRHASVNLVAGEQQLVFGPLPEAIVDDSLHVSGSGTARVTILDVAANVEWPDKTPDERVRALEDSLKDLQKQLQALNDHRSILEQQKALVVKMAEEAAKPASGGRDAAPPARLTPTEMQQVVDFYRASLDKLSLEILAADADRQVLGDKIAAATAQLDQVRGNGSRSVKNIAVRLSVAQAGSLDVYLSYEIPGAVWRPSYDARASTADHKVTLEYSGIVTQGTGEDWKGIELTLSTAHPSMGGAAPELRPWYVSKLEAASRDGEGYMAKSTLAGTRVRTDLKDIRSANSVVTAQFLQDIGSENAEVGTQATSATFRIPGATDLPSDKAPHKVEIAQIPLSAELTYVTTPKLMPAAFLNAAVTNNSDYPLLAGPMGVFLDDTFVAKARMKTVMPGEKFDLALGVDDGVKVERKLINRFTEDLGIITKESRVTYDILITVTNHRRDAVKVAVKDQLPVSRHEKIEVAQVEPSVDVLKPDDQGMLTWKLDLQPGEKKELPFKFSITYPNDLPVSGIE